MKVLVTGNGGREHALAWRVSLGASVSQVYVAPGNAGTALEANVENVPIAVDDFAGLAAFAEGEGVDLTIVGPEAPLVDGFADYFAERGLRCFGPSRKAARLEGSKAYTKAFLQRWNIPTAASETFTALADAKAFVRECPLPLVVKADGLAAGKGVVIAQELAEAEAALDSMLSGAAFGDAGRCVVVEEFLQGEEASFIALCDGRTALPFASSQDHKAAFDGDAGPNTGGMGAYSPAPVVSDTVHARIMDEIIKPTLKGMAAEGAPYLGFLYAGLMIAADGSPKVIEFNCRFGDPEAQPVMMRLKSDLAALCGAALDGELGSQALRWDERAALGVVMASGGYPGKYATGHPITGLAAAEGPDCRVFHAGTHLDGDAVLTSGGRVLCVTGLGGNVTEACEKAYQGARRISWQDARFRSDIGYRALAREAGG
ncbi:MAG: phosphoribosylamine--glycine ligase [Gammaproteobacteria bacterium]|nr:phosphoribosylamine--glycine ligase [Gammaproteobacteria bacterium]